MSRCTSCGAEILWIKTERGKLAPVDAKSEKRFVLDPLAARLAPDAPPQARLVDTFVSHFATCPNAAQHRKDRP